MKYLRTDKNIICSGTKDKEILSRVGYFNLINGYKEPFVTAVVDGVHVYYQGTSVKELHSVKRFDDELRLLLLRYITQVEEEVRTITAYKFDEINKCGKIAWYQVDAFDTSKDVSKIVKVISRVYSEIGGANQDYISYYLKHHNYIPTWIMIKVIRFYTLIELLEFSKVPVKKAITSLYGVLDNNGVPDFKLLIASLHWLRTVRNSCAHNERIFAIKQTDSRLKTMYMSLLAASYSRENDRKIIDLLVYMKYYLPENEYDVLMSGVDKLLVELKRNIRGQAFEYVRAALGIKDISHIEQLRRTAKTKPVIYGKIGQL